ncbi:hypothetical protein EVAR_33285_1 [Eumeta japonica]|uniref:Uncharacterized protein n=1 Tax=Eumeta variegata TaxID=151549 RepID=A0A4C1WGM2_EUMVA|nr:hypothetical protein EVAR_33285_1 [Eumeta japonica]
MKPHEAADILDILPKLFAALSSMVNKRMFLNERCLRKISPSAVTAATSIFFVSFCISLSYSRQSMQSTFNGDKFNPLRPSHSVSSQGLLGIASGELTSTGTDYAGS